MYNNERKPHVHADLIKAWADGAVIQWRKGGQDRWEDTYNNRISWSEDYEYRIQPKQSDLKKYGVEVGDVWSMKSVTWGYFVVKKSDTSVLVTALFEKVVTEVPYKELNTLLFRRGVVNKL